MNTIKIKCKKKTEYILLFITQRKKVLDFIHIYLEVNEYNFKRAQEFRYVFRLHITQKKEIQTKREQENRK